MLEKKSSHMQTAEPVQDEPAESIWSSILKGAASSKMVIQKNVLILGDPNSGKSTLVQSLLRNHNEVLANTQQTNTASMPISQEEKANSYELALSYTFVDIKDEDNEGC